MPGTRLIRRHSDSAEILVMQPGDRWLHRGTPEQVLVRHEEGGRLRLWDGLFTTPYGAMNLLASGRAVVIEED